MKVRRIVIPIIGLIFIFTQCVKKKGDEEVTQRPQKILVTFVLGKTLVKPAEAKSDWNILKVGKILGQNDQIKVGAQGRVVLQSETNSVITIKENSLVSINSLFNPQNNEEKTEVALKTGKTVINPRKLMGQSKFTVRTPSMVAGVRGTVFSVEYQAGKSKVAVQEGKVAVKPSVTNVKVEEKISGVEINPGQKAEINDASVKQLEKKMSAAPEQQETAVISEKAQETVEIETMNQEEQKIVNQDAQQTLQSRIDIELGDEGEIVSQETASQDKILGSLVVNSFGTDIYIDDKKVGSDYYASLFPQGTELNVEVKKDENVVQQKKVIITEGETLLQFTSQEELQKEIRELGKAQISKPFAFVSEGFSTNFNEMVKTGDRVAMIRNGVLNIASTDDPKKTTQISFNKKVDPVVASEGIFVANQNGDLEVYKTDGTKVGTVALGNIVLKTSISYQNGVAYLSDASGKVVGVNARAEKVFEYKAQGSVIPPILASGDYVVISSVYQVEVLKNQKPFSSFKLGRGFVKVLKKMGMIDSKIILPQDNNRITIRDLKGEVLKTVPAIPGDVRVISGNAFAVVYSSKAVVYDVQGNKIKEIGTGEIVVQDGKLFYPEGNAVISDDLAGNVRRIELEEPVSKLSIEMKDIFALSKTGKLYRLNF